VRDLKTFKVIDVRVPNLLNQLLGCDLVFASLDHNRGAVSVVGTHEKNVMTSHFLKANPKVRIKTLEHVS
jgi:hypothetical protein